MSLGWSQGAETAPAVAQDMAKAAKAAGALLIAAAGNGKALPGASLWPAAYRIMPMHTRQLTLQYSLPAEGKNVDSTTTDPRFLSLPATLARPSYGLDNVIAGERCSRPGAGCPGAASSIDGRGANAYSATVRPLRSGG